MNFLNVDIPVKNVPELDKGFVPLGLFFKNYQKGAAKPLCIAVERSGGQIGTYETKIYGTPEMEQADAYYVDRLVKFLLWSWGGFKVSICGDDNVAAAIRAAKTAAQAAIGTIGASTALGAVDWPLAASAAALAAIASLLTSIGGLPEVDGGSTLPSLAKGGE